MTDSTVQASADATTGGRHGADGGRDRRLGCPRAERPRALGQGPTTEERTAYAEPARARLAEAFDEGERRWRRGAMGVRMGRETQLAAGRGASLHGRGGRSTSSSRPDEWEEETSLPVRRRRVPLDDEGS
jgi:hypothetical protein